MYKMMVNIKYETKLLICKINFLYCLQHVCQFCILFEAFSFVLKNLIYNKKLYVGSRGFNKADTVFLLSAAEFCCVYHFLELPPTRNKARVGVS